MTGSPDPVAVLKAYHAAIDRLDFAAIEGHFAEDAEYVSGGVGGTNTGRPAILAAFRRYFEEYADQISHDDLVQAVSPVAARAVWRLTATSSHTGRRLERAGEETIQINAFGKIVRVIVSDR